MLEALQLSLPLSRLDGRAASARDHPLIVFGMIALVAGVGMLLAIISWARKR